MDRHTRLNCIFSAMKERCYNPKCKAYKDYGARGIHICEEWLDSERSVIEGTKIHNTTKGFVSFRKWALENGYNDTLTIDRIDVNGNYTPENCRWITMREQQNNTRKNLIITYKGKTQTLSMWCEELGLNYYRTRNRIFLSHWTIEKAFNKKENACYNLITYKGKTQSVAQWCRELNLNAVKIRSRLKRNWSVERAFETK